MSGLADERREYVASQSDSDLLAMWERSLSWGLRRVALAEIDRRGLVPASGRGLR